MKLGGVLVVVVVFQSYDSRTPLDPHCRAPSVNIRTRRHGPLVCLSQRRRGDRRRNAARPVHTRNVLSDTWNRSNDDSVHHEHSNLHDRSTLRNGTLSHKRPTHMASIGECNRPSGPPPSTSSMHASQHTLPSHDRVLLSALHSQLTEQTRACLTHVQCTVLRLTCTYARSMRDTSRWMNARHPVHAIFHVRDPPAGCTVIRQGCDQRTFPRFSVATASHLPAATPYVFGSVVP